ncbi:jg13406, partial [Pararge aegeria aegeria]
YLKPRITERFPPNSPPPPPPRPPPREPLPPPREVFPREPPYREALPPRECYPHGDVPVPFDSSTIGVLRSSPNYTGLLARSIRRFHESFIEIGPAVSESIWNIPHSQKHTCTGG